VHRHRAFDSHLDLGHDNVDYSTTSHEAHHAFEGGSDGSVRRGWDDESHAVLGGVQHAGRGSMAAAIQQPTDSAGANVPRSESTRAVDAEPEPRAAPLNQGDQTKAALTPLQELATEKPSSGSSGTEAEHVKLTPLGIPGRNEPVSHDVNAYLKLVAGGRYDSPHRPKARIDLRPKTDPLAETQRIDALASSEEFRRKWSLQKSIEREARLRSGDGSTRSAAHPSIPEANASSRQGARQLPIRPRVIPSIVPSTAPQVQMRSSDASKAGKGAVGGALVDAPHGLGSAPGTTAGDAPQSVLHGKGRARWRTYDAADNKSSNTARTSSETASSHSVQRDRRSPLSSVISAQMPSSRTYSENASRHTATTRTTSSSSSSSRQHLSSANYVDLHTLVSRRAAGDSHRV
jgi:hypothetical protein